MLQVRLSSFKNGMTLTRFFSYDSTMVHSEKKSVKRKGSLVTNPYDKIVVLRSRSQGLGQLRSPDS